LYGNSLQKGKQGKYSKPGIRISVNTKESHSDWILKLLEYAINNLNDIKNIRNEAIKLDYYDQPEDLSLKREILDSIVNRTSNEQIKSILNLKVYRGLQLTTNELEQVYYLQNDTFYFYTNEHIYLKLNSVFQIINVYEIGHLIFNTDTTLYYYNPKQRELSDKFSINEKGNGLFYLIDYDNYLKRVLFETHVPLQGKSGIKKEKYLLLADKNRLINNYDELENEIIKECLKEH